ncbi:hypothetical protein [Lactiplantibacillus carotarum]|uniref:hypothetical protein n=1 Tax=Lactiplantibacillus carotarum TaxID=2993456 RepID=UPI00298ED104|nr:hypothetical protein [Lactiplantibacillus carotarum]
MKNVTKVVTGLATVAGALSFGNPAIAHADTTSTPTASNTEMKANTVTPKAVVQKAQQNVQQATANQQLAGKT